MSYINDGKYYLVRQNDIETEVIKLNEKWYLDNGNDILRRGNDISSIDLVTSKFSSLDELRNRMTKNGYINEIDKLFIVSSHNFSNKEYVNEFDFIFKGKHTDVLKKLANERLLKERIDTEKVKNVMYEFITKIFTDDTFYEFMTSGFNKIEPNFIELIMEYKKNHKEYSKSDYSIMYKLGNRLESYTFIRNIIAAWNSYDELINKYNNDPDKIRKIINDYIENKNNNKKKTEPIREKINKNYIEGQMNMEDWVKENNSDVSIKDMFKENPCNKEDDYFKDIHDLENEVNNSDFDSPILQDLQSRGIDKLDMVSYLKTEDIQKLSDKDRYKLGMIDIIEYKNSVNNDGKRYN